MTAEFRSLALSDALVEITGELGFTTMTPIQARGIPVLLAGQDLIAQSRTGTGKTAAFVLPILQGLDLDDRVPSALVLCPTRELSAQVAREFRKFGRRHAGLRVLVLCGGEARRPQATALGEGAHVIVGTPGRLLDHLRRGDLDLGRLRTVVLDEADRMLDMGFEEDMQSILAAVPARRQTAFFSATFPSSIQAMSRKHQRAPVQVKIEEDGVVPGELRHLASMVEPEHKLEALRWALGAYPHASALVFANFKASVATLVNALTAMGSSADGLHGDLEQFDRDRVLAKFRNGTTRVLVATDVAARGIDVAGLDLVINYEFPTKPEVYIHRAGRTGRAGKDGVALSFVTSTERARLDAVEVLLGAPLSRVKRTRPEGPEAPSSQPVAQAAAMDTLRIGGGRKAKIRPADILGALTGEAGGLAGSDIGKIEIHDDFSYVAVARTVSRQAARSLSDGKIKGRKFRVAIER